jgi:transcriptional regulator with XRE-family HTH domain
MTNQTSDRNNIDALVGQRVREAREAAGLTQAQLGALLGCSFNKIHNIETGTVRITVADTIEIARHLEVPPLFLMRDVIEVTDVVELLRDLVDERERVAVRASDAQEQLSRLDGQISAIQQVVSREGSGQ